MLSAHPVEHPLLVYNIPSNIASQPETRVRRVRHSCWAQNVKGADKLNDRYMLFLYILKIKINAFRSSIVVCHTIVQPDARGNTSFFTNPVSRKTSSI